MLEGEARSLDDAPPADPSAVSFIALIPARTASTRLPDKPLADIAGKPMVVRTAERAARSGAAQVCIATDDARVLQAAQAHGVRALMTRGDHPTGTDRLAEAVAQLGLPDDAIVVSVRGDEPLIEPELIDAVAAKLQASPDADIATCACPLADAQALFNPNVVKLVCTASDRALYFSRAPIPGRAMRWPAANACWPTACPPCTISACTPTACHSCAAFRRCPGRAGTVRVAGAAARHGARPRHRGPPGVHAPAAGVDTPADLSACA